VGNIPINGNFRVGEYTINGALIGGILVPGVLIVLLAVWPWLDKSPVQAVGVWFAAERRWQKLVFLGIVIVLLALTVMGAFMRGPYCDSAGHGKRSPTWRHHTNLL
jgi:cytochrome b-561